MLNNSRLNIDKYLLQFHVMPVGDLCPCFKQHYQIQVNPIRIHPRLLREDEPEPEPQPEATSEPQPGNAIPPQIPEQMPANPSPGPQNSHPPVNVVSHEAQNMEVAPHSDNQVSAQAMEPPHEEEVLAEGNVQQNDEAPKREANNNEPKQDNSQNAMYSSNNPHVDTVYGTNNNKNAEEEAGEDLEGLSFLDEDGDSLFSSGFDDSFELQKPPAQNANPSRFRFA